MFGKNGRRKQELARAWAAIHCTGCGCGWRGGMSDESQDYMRAIVKQGWGLVRFPGCDGCPCHDGKGVLPHIRVYET